MLCIGAVGGRHERARAATPHQDAGRQAGLRFQEIFEVLSVLAGCPAANRRMARYDAEAGTIDRAQRALRGKVWDVAMHLSRLNVF